MIVADLLGDANNPGRFLTSSRDLSRMKIDLLLPLVIPVFDLLPMPSERWAFDVRAFRILSDDAFEAQGQRAPPLT